MFYEDLKKQRESLGLSLDQIANRIKVDKVYLNNFEKGVFTDLPRTYIRLFLRSYAAEIGLKADEILAAYEEFSASSTPPPQPEIPKSKETIIPFKNGKIFQIKKKRNIATILVIIVIIIFIIFNLKQVLIEDTSQEIALKPGLPSNMSLNQAEPDSATALVHGSTPSSRDTSHAAGIPLFLVLQTKDSCWIHLVIDNIDTREAILPPNALYKWKATDNFDIRIGRPTAITLYLNDKNLDLPGNGKRPLHLVIDNSGIVTSPSIIKP